MSRHLHEEFKCRFFEVFDARIALALNTIIHTSHFKRSNPLFADLWVKKPQTNGFHEFIFIVHYFVAAGSFTADGGLL